MVSEPVPRSRILVVDDDQIMVSLLHTLLQLDGFEVLSGQPDVPFLESVRASRPDLILMDVFLRGTDGLDLLSQLKSDPEMAGTPVVMCSGMDVSEQCNDRGAQAFLLKPYSPDHLLTTIQACLAMPGSPKGQS